ncbi:MAG: hypothetical protein HFG26_08890 [Provencibacterium sp.]|nr:hypothetical protein [Provencibacterium sp.]
MKIRIEREDGVFEYERRPMRRARFRALCAIAIAAIYAGALITVAALCGVPGLVTMLLFTMLVGLGISGTLM